MKQTDIVNRNSIFAWIGLATALLLLIPVIAMQLTQEVNWSAGDFLTMGALLFATCSGFVVVSRKVRSNLRIPIAILFAALFLFFWAELAVGVFFHFGS